MDTLVVRYPDLANQKMACHRQCVSCHLTQTALPDGRTVSTINIRLFNDISGSLFCLHWCFCFFSSFDFRLFASCLDFLFASSSLSRNVLITNHSFLCQNTFAVIQVFSLIAFYIIDMFIPFSIRSILLLVYPSHKLI